MNKKRVSNYIGAIITVLSFMFVSVGATYAAYVVFVLNNGAEVTLRTANVVTMFEAMNDIHGEDILPGYRDTLEFSITNVSKEENMYGDYTLLWEIKKNELCGDDFVYTLTGTSVRNGVNIPITNTNKLVNVSNKVSVPSVSSSIGKGTINTGVTHKYTLTLEFLESGALQNEYQGKTFSGKIVAKGE